MVSSDPAAIGYISIGLVDRSVKALGLNSVMPSEAAIDAGGYVLVRPFLFVMPARRNEQVEDFVAWVTGPKGRALARSEGLLPATAEEGHGSLARAARFRPPFYTASRNSRRTPLPGYARRSIAFCRATLLERRA